MSQVWRPCEWREWMRGKRSSLQSETDLVPLKIYKTTGRFLLSIFFLPSPTKTNPLKRTESNFKNSKLYTYTYPEPQPHSVLKSQILYLNLYLKPKISIVNFNQTSKYECLQLPMPLLWQLLDQQRWSGSTSMPGKWWCPTASTGTNPSWGWNCPTWFRSPGHCVGPK